MAKGKSFQGVGGILLLSGCIVLFGSVGFLIVLNMLLKEEQKNPQFNGVVLLGGLILSTALFIAARIAIRMRK